jgi:hypothetical protein
VRSEAEPPHKVQLNLTAVGLSLLLFGLLSGDSGGRWGDSTAIMKAFQ